MSSGLFVLAVEEHLVARDLRTPFGHRRLDGGAFPVEGGRPVAQHEGIPLHGLRAVRHVLLAEEPPPGLRAVEGEHLALHPLRLLRRRLARPQPVRPVLDVVVPRHEEARDGPPVRRPVVGEHRVPRLGDELQLADAPRREEVARHEHRIHLLRVEVAQRLDEVLVRVAPPGRVVRDVDVGDDAHAELRGAKIPHRRAVRPRHRAAGSACGAKGRGNAKEFTSVHTRSSR